MLPSAHVDTFARDNLPPPDQWPDLLLDGFDYPERLNAAVELTDRLVEAGHGDRIALIGRNGRHTYRELAAWTNRIAGALRHSYGLLPGQRVLIRSGNNPAAVAMWLGATKAGAVVVNTMPLLRAVELEKVACKAEVRLALCDSDLIDGVRDLSARCPSLERVIEFDGTGLWPAELDEAEGEQPDDFTAVATSQDDVALLGFTSGTTGEPKATVHFHRDLLIIADAYAGPILQMGPEDVCVGTPPLAFTFGLGGIAIFPLRFGGTSVLLEQLAPSDLVDAIEEHGATVCFTAPIGYRRMLQELHDPAALETLRCGVSAGETLPAPIFESWRDTVGRPLLDGIGATEMLHIFITNRLDDARPACTGRPVPGYEARVVNDEMRDVPTGEVGRLAVRGPTGCRYLADDRQAEYVQDGWNLTGDSFWQDEEGRFHFAARTDDMIISAGYNIAGPEVEAALLAHPAVAECGVVGAHDEERGMIVEAHVVLQEDAGQGDGALVAELQAYVKAAIAPYKYPRRVVFVDELPKTTTGKIQRFRLREG